MAIVELNNIHLKTDRGTPLFTNLNFCLSEKKSAVIVGPAGAGKTSLVELLVGLRFPDSGSVEVLGTAVKRGQFGKILKVRKNIGGVGGPFGLMDSLTVAENVAMPLVIAGEPKRIFRGTVDRTLSELSLLPVSGDYPRSLTRVERTLTQLARSVVTHQPLVIIDEPAAGLDQATSERVFAFLKAITLSGRSLIIVASEKFQTELPGADYYRFSHGALKAL
ncbi:MAG: ATP-binding cassette domain-containing protein [candidate division Zixibacteria bacterium]|nr:ATP-binding cassette domain-containing protein [candidate division Zixibacteria bacterium]